MMCSSKNLLLAALMSVLLLHLCSKSEEWALRDHGDPEKGQSVISGSDVNCVTIPVNGVTLKPASSFDCCLRYTERILRPNILVGFTQQLANEACDINAVVFYTRKKLAVCADPKKKWVKQVVHMLSQRVKRM